MADDWNESAPIGASTPGGTFPGSTTVDGEGSSRTLEIISMMADMVICQSCHRQIAQYQCTYCLQVNCPACTTDDPERVACRFPCESTESRLTKGLRNNAPEILTSANRVAVSERPRAYGGAGLQSRVGATADQGRLEAEPQRTGSRSSNESTAITVACLQERVVNLDGTSLPSEMVGDPTDPGTGWYAQSYG